MESASAMPRGKLKIVTPQADASEHRRYVLDGQVGFLPRVAMQRHTSIFTTRMIEGLTQTQFAALAKLHDPADRRRRTVELTERGRQVTQSAMLIAAEITAATLAAFSEDERRQVTRLLKKLG
jgi:hypothetical protein